LCFVNVRTASLLRWSTISDCILRRTVFLHLEVSFR
jgi:hypothetical protein